MSITDDITVLTSAHHPSDWTDLDTRAVDTVRVLAADAVQKVGNGHPGTAMSLAPLAYSLFQRTMRHDPTDTTWIGRDRFVLSCGHSSLTLYIQLYLGGFGLELADLEALRTFKSKTPGHPEFRHTKGVEITTGPLGQGLASAVGMAMASRRERGLFDPEPAWGDSPFDHYVYVIASDGDIEEGITSEASSLAGTQQLGNLILFYDDNKISIEHSTDIALSEDTAKRYEAYGWHVQVVEGGENVTAIEEAVEAAKAVTDKPSIIVLRTIIGFPAPTMMNTGAVHGAALGDDEVAAVKKALGFDPEKTFEVTDEVIEHTRGLQARGRAAHEAWSKDFDAWSEREPDRRRLLDRLTEGTLPDGWTDVLPTWEPGGKAIATRAASGEVLSAVGPVLPELWGGSADLAGSNNTTMKGAKSFGPTSISTDDWDAEPYGRTLHFGIREHAMGAILSGIVMHGPTRAYGGTFMQFSDYMRPAVRLASLMDIDPIYVWTHDSVGLGEDGPTHQPVEHLAALRAIPNLSVVRPGDANETAHAWRAVLARSSSSGPVGLALTRQGIPILDGTSYEGVSKGGYVLVESSKAAPDVIIVATGSEVQYAVEAQKLLEAQDIAARVVSMPCVEWFESQDQNYRDQVLPPTVKARVSIEAGIAMPWYKIVGGFGEIISLEHFGESADAATLFREYGFTAEAVVAAAQRSITNVKG
ncbi:MULTISPECIES: transketolase [unclassified Rhodococcus (in: high G+C Gram-positive bacteria)]|uniref:transketolase n=1 Tax=unclassified Rhodococcus (in: high G+C Gram-positive bacteria) TaxID=192944 RepID=UPI000483F4AA|nr:MULTISPECIES: transketolase [unclassified Rhodococcus (in: high G+C Gram-positive bacteria)]KQU34598.1 transketolase [Rhodococcus sp. Leaf225]KQU45360.1 transketolase [Rhodococcus sp. Leaf258]MBY6687019.1 transketolase [Rhodococcus sp. BP-288]MBY6693928.1 transketolase [Rhodococcus sp. BP-188]MBY6699131.1 transketolase [Rhodococcus sp. BP-285]